MHVFSWAEAAHSTSMSWACYKIQNMWYFSCAPRTHTHTDVFYFLLVEKINNIYDVLVWTVYTGKERILTVHWYQANSSPFGPEINNTHIILNLPWKTASQKEGFICIKRKTVKPRKKKKENKIEIVTPYLGLLPL